VGYLDKDELDITNGLGSRANFIRACDFERCKFDLYLKILTNRLNEIHAVKESTQYWETMIGFVLWVNIANCRRVYDYANSCSEDLTGFYNSSYTIPKNQAEFSKIYSFEDTGDKQLLSQYNVFFKKRIPYIGPTQNYYLDAKSNDINKKHSTSLFMRILLNILSPLPVGKKTGY
jgi:hypothetical protein